MDPCSGGWIECHPGLAAWIQTFGTFIALAIAIVVPAAQHRADNRRREIQENNRIRTTRQQMVAGLTAEIKQADRALLRKVMIVDTLLGAIANGEEMDDLSKRSNVTLWISDRDFYRATASNLGVLPAGLTAKVVQYYGEMRQVEDLATYSDNLLRMLQSTKASLPHVRFLGETLRVSLRKFKEADYSDTSDIKLTLDEMKLAAKKTGYDLNPYIQELQAGVMEGIGRFFRGASERSAEPQDQTEVTATSPQLSQHP